LFLLVCFQYAHPYRRVGTLRCIVPIFALLLTVVHPLNKIVHFNFFYFKFHTVHSCSMFINNQQIYWFLGVYCLTLPRAYALSNATRQISAYQAST
jgi:hypothetical protein